MERADALALARGVGCGAVTAVVVLGVTWLLLAGLAMPDSLAAFVSVFLDAHRPLSAGPVAGLDPLTWFAIPASALYAVPPLSIACGGVAAGRLTRETDLRIGALAGAAVAPGYVVPLAALVLSVGADASVLAPATAIALVCGAIGGIVGVRT